jgi:hypothetical protein
MRIDAHEATITTATVEIRCLTINGKQVTLAVFRQLMDEEWDEVSPLWGQVNYCPDKQCRNLDWAHTHIVWQKGDQLRRAVVEAPRAADYPRESWDNGRWVMDESTKEAWRYDQQQWMRMCALPHLFIAV